jgi:hypothetical protein
MTADSSKCDQEVYEKGTVVMYCPPLPSEKVEAWLEYVRDHSEQKVDWHRLAGRVIVKAIGNLNRVHQAILASRDLFRSLFVGDSFAEAEGAFEDRLTQFAPAEDELDVDLEMWPYDKQGNS